MATREHTSATCPVNPAAPVFFTLADGIRRFEERAGNLCWDDLPVEEGRIISYEPIHLNETPVTAAARYDDWGGWETAA